ncbi:MXAN_6230/SCO0854 family RING domain-containing protein [Undibacterium sp. TC4M20W]|uniref:MXAN_6230/SCO0854 family RING domain-containing protein n=1 Tax=Undibacterium sp. TC4M20W TaxID=3413052 RepID=UPI003BF404A3
MTLPFSATQALLLRRKHLVFVEAGTGAGLLPESHLQAFEINLAKLGYAISTRLRLALQGQSANALTQTQKHVWKVLLGKVGGNQQLMPQFRRFPEDVPADTHALWRQRVLSHFLQLADQPCLFCSRTGSTHVLAPCEHVVCSHCYDGSNYSACPVCGQQTESSAFFKPAQVRQQPKENIIFKLLDLGQDVDAVAKELLHNLCERKQAMSPVDKDDFIAIVQEYGMAVIPWLPQVIPVRENIALLFGNLLKQCEPALVMDAAKSYIGTATDVLRLIAAYSGADPALQGQTVYRQLAIAEMRGVKKYRPWFESSHWLAWAKRHTHTQVTRLVKRFKVAKLSRPLRKSLLGFMESLRPDLLTEDMLRHRSYWVWMGEFLHPHEYKNRYPQVAAAFTIIRKKSADGTPAPAFQTYYGKLEASLRLGDAGAMAGLLAQRPGELARRLDLLLRTAGTDETALAQVKSAFQKALPQFATPVLLTLLAHLPVRTQAVKTRIYWPKGQVAKAVFAPETRANLDANTIVEIVAALEEQLMQRFAAKPLYDQFIIDRALQDIIVPFNERTASKSAISLPRGSSIAVTPEKTARLFLHWCQPENNASRTDLDLSVGFYDTDWQYQGVCSYYQLQLHSKNGQHIASSSGDITSAPFPDGASEFVDIDLEAAQLQGIRYAVVVLNNYSGMAFEDLERAYAGIMFRDDVQGHHFDPRTVELRFNLQGGNGIFLPMVIDLQDARLHWLDMYSTGMFAMNNVASSNNAITTICPELIAYFASGTRPSMYELCLLHAAARGQEVLLRGKDLQRFMRAENETNAAFLARLRRDSGQHLPADALHFERSIFAALYEGDLPLPEGSAIFALKPAAITGNLAASDLLS